MIRKTSLQLFSFFSLGTILLGSASCSSSLPELTIKLDQLAASDTVAYVTYVGDHSQQTDTLLHFSRSITLTPDTARFRSLSFVHAGGEQILFYAWDGKQWASQQVTPVADQPEEGLPTFSAKDVQGKERRLEEFYQHHPVELVFVSPETLQGISADEQKKIRQEAKTDSLTFVFLYPAVSDSTTRRLLRQANLQGIAFSDSLGLVSNLRRRYGVAQEAKTIRLRIDTLGKLHR